MHFERRRVLRRAVSGGVVLSTVSMILIWLLEVAYVLLVRRPAFETYTEGLRFCLFMLMLLLSCGAVFGAIEGLIVLGVTSLTKVLAKQRLREPPWMARIYSIIALPAIAIFAASIFAGRRAQQIPGKDLIAFGLGLLFLLGTYAALRVIIGARDRFRIRRWGPRQAGLLFAALIVIGSALYIADQRILSRLYFFLHVALTILTIGVCQLSVGAVYCGWRSRARWMGRLTEPSVSLLLFIGGIAGLTWSLNRIGVHQNLRFIYFEHTVVQSKMLGLASSLGLSRRPQPVPASQPTRLDLPREDLMAGPQHPEANVLLISIDALRADHMGVYGYRRKTTPNLDRWASKAAVFERGYCPVPHTSFSVTSLMTGTYIYSAAQVDPGRRHRTMAEVLRRYGYKTAAFFPPAVFYIDRSRFKTFEQSKFGFEYVKYQYIGARGRVDQMLTFLKKNARKKFFIWAHFFEPHEPYVKNPRFDFGPRAMDRYDSEIATVDHHLGRLIAYIQASHPNTIIALTADHGEEFGEHGGHYHGNSLYEQQVRVPLIVSLPRGRMRKISGAAQMIDLPATLLSVVDAPLPAGMRGTDLGPWIAGEAPSRLPPAFSEMERKKLVVHEGHKLLCDTARDFCELYDLERDPLERTNLFSRRPALARRLKGHLSRWMASHAPRHERVAAHTKLLDRGRQKDPGAVDGLIGLCEGKLEIRREAVRLLTLMRTPRALKALVAAAGDLDPGVGNQATVGAAMLGHGKSLDRVKAILARPDLPPPLRRDALLALAQAGDQAVAAPLAEVLRRSTDIYERLEIIEELGKLKSTAAAPALRRQLETLRTRLAAINALGMVGARGAIPELARSLRNDRFISWRKAAARALGQIGTPAVRAPLVEVVHRELERDVLQEALAALKRLGALGAVRLPRIRGKWRCAAGTCTLPLRGTCAAPAGTELILMTHGGGQVKITCGAEVLGGTTPGSSVAVVGLPRDKKGPLQLETRGPPPTLDFAALRPVPRRPKPAEQGDP